MNSPSILSTQGIAKLFMKYCVPAVIAMVITGLQGMIDGIFVGTFVGSYALAGVNIALPFMQIIVGVSMVISIGTQSYVGLKLGQGDIESAQNSFNTFKIIILSISFFITLLGLTLNKEIADLLGANEILLDDSASYIKYISIFALPMCAMFYFGFLNRIIGRPERYFYGGLLSIIVNISLDYLLIVCLNLGVRGAALATGLAYTSALFVIISPMLNKENIINIFVGKFSAKSIDFVLYNGSSEGINSISIAVTAFLFNVSLMQIEGPDGVAAFTAINYVGTLATMLLFGVSDGIGPIVSYNFGSRDYGRVKQLMKLSYYCNFAFGIVLFSLLFFLGEQLVGLFIKNNPDLVTLAVVGGKLYGFSFLMSGFNILNSGYFTFIGRGFESVIVAASRGVVFVSIGIFVLPKFLGIDGIWLSVPFAEFCAVIVGFLLLKRINQRVLSDNSLQAYENSMSENEKTINSEKQPFTSIITINRQFGSGGREVAKRLADTLGCAYYDKELLNIVAKEIGVSSELVDKLDETNISNINYTFSRSFMSYSQLPIEDINISERKLIQELAHKTKGIFVGRCANKILSEHNPLKVYIYSSSMDFRIDRCFDKVPSDLQTKLREDIEKEILAIDSKRSAYYKNKTGDDWGNVENYNLCIDTSKVSIKKAVEIIVKALQ